MINILHTQLHKRVHCTGYTDFFSFAREYNKIDLKQFNSLKHFFSFCRELPGLEDLQGKMANLEQQVTRFVSSTVSSRIFFVYFNDIFISLFSFGSFISNHQGEIGEQGIPGQIGEDGPMVSHHTVLPLYFYYHFTSLPLSLKLLLALAP